MQLKKSPDKNHQQLHVVLFVNIAVVSWTPRSCCHEGRQEEELKGAVKPTISIM